MKKEKKVVILIFISFLVSVAFVSSVEINAANISLITNYSRGNILSGNFTLRVNNIYPNSSLRTNLGHSISLRDFLKNNSAQLSCEPFNCVDKYLNSSFGTTSTRLQIRPNSLHQIGLRIDGTNIEIKDFQMFSRLNFPEGNTTPLRMNLEERELWRFSNETENFVRHVARGFLGSPTSNRSIGAENLCQRMTLVPTRRIFVGGRIIGSTNDRIEMNLFRTNGNLIGECNFTTSNASGCIILLENELVVGDYFVCIKSNLQTNLLIGFSSNLSGRGHFRSIHSAAGGDYDIFAKIPTYLDRTNVETRMVNENERDRIVNRFQTYLISRYRQGSTNRANCSAGCFIPLTFSGIEQTLEIINISLLYQDLSGTIPTNKVYNLTRTPTKASFNGFVELEKADFKLMESGNRSLILSLERDNQRTVLFERRIIVRAIPIIIREIFPLVIPAGVNSLLVVDFFSIAPIRTFRWSFGDGTTEITERNRVFKTYQNIGFYNLTIEITNNLNETSTKNFTINTINPRNYLNLSFDIRRKDLARINSQMDSLVVPLKEKIRQRLNLSEIQHSLDSMDAERRTATLGEEGFLELALRIQNLKIPRAIWVEGIVNELFITDSDQIDLAPLSILAGRTLSGEEYKRQIASWEIMNVNGTKEITTVAITDGDGIKTNFATVYRVRVRAEDDAYLIIQNGMGMDSSVGLTQTGTARTLALEPRKERYIELISFGESHPLIYVSPDPKEIEVVKNISPCNSNRICEKKLGEDYKNCRSDCKPWLYAIILWSILGITTLVALIFIPSYFKKRYELKLFKSQQELLNLAESIKNSRENKIPEREVVDKLIKSGWSREQISYAIKKSRGGRTRPYELIPLDRIKTLFQKKK